MGSSGTQMIRSEFFAKLRSASQRVLLLDYDGTLREVIKDPASATLTPELRDLLDRLSKLKNVETTIISGRTSDDLERFLSDYPAFGLVAEHGAAAKQPGDGWEQLDQNLDLSWKGEIERILRLYEESTPGTHIEEKRTSLVWHYRRADPEFGKWKANQLVDELSIVAANVPIEVRHGRKIVEVASAQINKGAAVSKILAAGGPYDLVLMAGDDATDESMFKTASNDEHFITIRVGDGDTHARFRVATPANLRQFLEGALPR
jgi:trehalose 6-phosphate synthase/phosphatase